MDNINNKCKADNENQRPEAGLQGNSADFFLPIRSGWDPVLTMKSIQSSFNEMIADIFSHPRQSSSPTPFTPLLNMSRFGEVLHLSIALPGISSDDVSIHATRDLVIIRGKIPAGRYDRGDTVYCKEMAHGEFSRSIPLPCQVEHEKVITSLDRGILEITLPVRS